MTSAVQFAIDRILALACYCPLYRDALCAVVLVQSLVIQASPASELDQSHELVAVSHQHIGPHVIGLLAPGRPPAVAGFIIPVVIDPVEARTGRPRSHVFEERSEIIAPSVTHTNAAAAPVVETDGLLVVTTGLRLAPGLVFTTRAVVTSAADRVAVSAGVSTSDLFQQAPTARRATTAERIPENDCHGSAVAPAKPLWMTARIVVSADSNKSAEANACQIVQFHTAIVSKAAIL
jgi:hypothetical protein